MKKLILCAAFAAALLATPAAAAELVVPSGPGNAQGPSPLRFFGSGGSRVQQIYGASYFSGPQLLSAISFRAFPGVAPSFLFGNTVNVSDILIRAGTTAASGNDTSGGASASFADNLLNAQTVYSGMLSLSTAATGTGPQPFDYTINFANPFAYDPGAGSLILDFLIPTTATVSGSGFGFLTFDNVNTIDDGVFSVVDINNGATTSGTLSTAGAITQFTTSAIAPVPEPAIWAMMIIGFGFTGGMIRRQRRVASKSAVLA